MAGVAPGRTPFDSPSIAMAAVQERLAILTRPRSSSRAELMWAGLALAVLGGLAYLPHILHGGFYLDDWADASNTLRPGEGIDLGKTLDLFYGLTPYRPGLVVYVPLKYLVLGANPARQLILSAGLAIAVGWVLYGVLRECAVPWFHSWTIAALTVVFPSFDSVRFWEAASLPSLSLLLAVGGLWLALRGLARRSWPLHALAAAMFLASILVYEIALPLIAVFGLLYVFKAGWREARWRWATDLLVAIAGGTWNLTHTVRVASGLSGDFRHAREIADASRTVLASAVYPLGESPPTTTALIALAALFAAGLATYLIRRPRPEGSWGLREWLILAAVGLGVAILGWVDFIPADPYYTPSLLGGSNRVNAVAGIGLVIIAYSAIGIAVFLATGLLAPLRRWSPAFVVALGVLLGASYVHVLERHSDLWDSSTSYQKRALARIESAFPRLPPDSMLYTTDYPANLSPGVPIFSANWDLNGAVQLEYDDYSLRALPILEGSELVCQAHGVGVAGTQPSEAWPYGRALLVNLANGQHARPADRGQCERQVPAFHPGPGYAQAGY
jgi:hypothetical protein